MLPIISNNDDLINSDEVITRIEALKKSQQDIEAELETLKRSAAHGVNARIDTLQQEKQDIEAEREALESLAEEASAYNTEWEKGIALIRDSYFKDYAQESAKEITLLPDGVSWDDWPFSCIDWERVARELETDYHPVEFDRVKYWVRCE